ncbi:MAG TPA: DUF6531 domain-containing protein, partial [Vicinamibacterales bacterium]
DASDPAGLSSASPIATMAVPGAPGQIPAGEDWALATDDHDRIWATGLTSTFGVVRSYRVEDVVNGANTQAPPVIGEKATSIVSWRVGVDAGLPLSTDAVTISDRPEALPRKMRIVVQDGQPATFASMAALIAGYNGTGAVDIGGGFLKTTLQVDSARQSPYLLQRVTVRNLTRTFSWSVDVARNRTASITVIGQADDQFEVRHNYTTYGVVSLFGYGVGIFDLNAIDSNRAAANDSTLDPSYVPLNERVLMTRAEMNASCDPTVASGGVTCDPEAMANSGQHCPIPDLTFSPEAAIAASTETPSQLVVYGVEQNHGLVELRVRPAQSATEPATCSRANSLVFMERVPHNGTIDWFGHPRLNTLRNLFRTAAGRDPIARFATISTYTRTNATGATTMYGLVSAYEYGVLVVKLDPNGALNDDSLVDVVWIPSGATAVRVLNGQNVASVVDGKGRVLLIDLTQLDESARVPPHVGCPSFDCTSDLYPVTTGALTGTSAAPDEVGADDPRIVWKQKIDPHDPPLPFGTLAPLVDPDSGFIYTGNANGKDVRVTSAIDPHVHIQVSSGASDGHLVDAAAIVPLGIEPAANPAGTGAVFRLSVSLPGSITDSLATSSHELRFAVESEAVPGAPVAQSPAGFPRAHLRQADARGTVDPRAASSFTMQRLAPNASDADARKLRYQRGYNAWASPWIIALADIRASRAWAWNGTNPAAAGCVACTAPGPFASLPEPQAFELLASGRFIAARSEVMQDGTSIFGAAYGYLGAANRVVARVPTWGADTVRPVGIAIAGQNPPLAGGMLQESLYIHSGEVAAHHVDLVVGGEARMGFTVDRTYLSRTIGGTPFGLGWSSSMFARLRALPNGNVEYRDGMGETWVFTATSTGGIYTTPPGLFVYLYREPTTNVLTMRDASGNFSFFDSLGRLMARADSFADPTQILNGHSAGNVIRYLYDGRGRLTTIVDAAGRSTTITYADSGCIAKIVDWRGRQVNYEYDLQGRLTTVRLPRVAKGSNVPDEYDFTSDQRRPHIDYGYAAAGSPLNDTVELGTNLISITDPAGGSARVTFAYGTDGSSRDKEIGQTWATGETASMTYPSTTQTVVTDALGLATTYDFAQQFDSRMHVTQMRATVPAVNFDLGPLPQTAPVSTTLAQPVDVFEKFTYDHKGELKSVQYVNNRIDVYTNGAADGSVPWTVVQSIEEQGGTRHKTTFAYDAAASAPATALVSVTAQDANNAAASRDAQTASRARFKTSSFDNEGAIVGNERLRDAQGRPVKQQTIGAVPSPDGQLATSGITSASQVAYVRDNHPNLYARGRAEVASASGTHGETERYTHAYAALPSGGEHEQITDAARGVVTEIDRDGEARVVRNVIKDSDGDVITDESTGYDASGRVAYTSRKQGSLTVVTTTKYDAVGRPTSTTMESGATVMGSDAAVTSETTYDLPHQTVTTTDSHLANASAAQTVTTLDGMGRAIKTVRISADRSQSLETDYGYDPLGRESYRTDTHAAVARRFDTQGREVGTVDESGVRT